MELGLLDEAMKEYGKLFHLGYFLEDIFPEITECLIKLFKPSEFIEQINRMISKDGLADHEKARIKFVLGLEMEKRGHQEIALNLFQSSASLDPNNQRIKSRLESTIAARSTGSKYDYLISKKLVSTAQLQKALRLSKKSSKSIEYLLIEQFKVSKEEIGKSLSAFYGCPFRSYDTDVPVPVELLGNLKQSFLIQELWVPFSWDKEGVEVLINDPKNLKKTDLVKVFVKSPKIDFSVGIKEDIEAYIRFFFNDKTSGENDIDENLMQKFDMIPEVVFEEEQEEEEEETDEASGEVVQLLDQVLVVAYRQNASDIHVEPSTLSKTTKIRFRLDGVCQDYLQVPNSLARGILSRLKIMAGLDIAERRLPQDGKIKFKRKGVPPFELRLATVPVAGGFEQAVLRILAKAGAMKVEDMGLNERNLQILKKIISIPYGLVLVVGPTGSGKTTSLHAALGHINKPGVKIWTAEDPIEITQAGLSQVEAKPIIGLDFAKIMRSFLRADPDVIMIGEMRDHETASIGVEASLTGHLVFSTLHTNSAPETVTRLLDMGLNPLNFSDAFLGVLAQRLVRRLCKNCRENYHPSKEEFEELANDYGREPFAKTGINFTTDLTLYRPKGCEKCSDTGYKGRLGVHELMEGTPEIKKKIKKQASTEELFSQASEEGMTTLRQDGIMKVFQGLTDIMEIRRVTTD
jgi:type II secretory ATPase GspE/PulE/Tfp pilus assembly ATPase PilB-like protein